MAIFHFKHSYLDWRVNTCKRRNDLWFCNFIIFSTFFDSLDFHLDSTQIFQVHDTTINFSFLLFFFYSHDWSAPGNDACHRWPSKLKRLFLVWGLFWKVGLLVQGCLYHLFLEDMAQKYSREIGNFGQHAPRHQSRWSQNIMILGTCVFWVIERVLAGLKL